jgi:hypothetical protein
MRIAPVVTRRAPVIAACGSLSGCGRVPSISVVGTFFPAWMLCILIGIALTLAARQALLAVGLEPWIGPRVVMYPSLSLSFTLATWLIFFRD